jgi:cytochrome c oxidase subunit 2
MNSLKMSSLLAKTLAGLGLVVPAITTAVPSRWELNMPQGVTDTARQAYDMHMIMFWICVVIGFVVFGAMFYAMFKFRKSKGAVADTHMVHSTKLEIVWTLIPVAILVVMAYPATKYLMATGKTNESEMTVKITAYQWKWRYEILDYKNKPLTINFLSSLDSNSNKTRQLGSGLDPWSVKQGEEETYLLNVDNPLVLPVNTKIRFLITADDVIHAWWVPVLGWKQDAVPGFINEAWTNIKHAGVYRGQCAELCGKDHGFMPIVIKAVEPNEFEAWMNQQSQAVSNKTIAVADNKQ